MLRYLAALICCFLTTPVFSDEDEPHDDLFLSTPEQIAALASEPSYLIGGVVSPLSGQLVLRQTDLVIKGAQTITLSRTYIPSYMPCSFEKHKHNKEAYYRKYLAQHLEDNYQGWQFYPHLRCEIDPRARTLRLADPSGMTLDFSLSGSDCSIASLASPPYAVSNVAGDAPSGQYDLRNTRTSSNDGGRNIFVHVPDGTTRIYHYLGPKEDYTLAYRLEKEILPNGKILKYTYGRKRLQSVQALDPQERYVYSTLHIEGAPQDNYCHFTSSSGLTADYAYERREFSWKIKERSTLKISTRRENATSPPILTTVNSPFYRHESLSYNDRVLLSSYSGQENIFDVIHGCASGKENHYVVHKFQSPVGHNDAFGLVHQIFYELPIAGEKEGSTAVNNSDGTTTRYFFSKNLLTTCIQYYGQDGSLKKEKLFSWTDNNWFSSLEVRDGQKKLLYRKAYEYDRYGNPIVETFTGDLTGKGNVETFTTKRTFSEDGKNLLLKQETEDGKVLCFTYLPGTNLPTSKLTKDHDQIIFREFQGYDDCNNLIQTISDDGSSDDKDNVTGVTQKSMKTYLLRQSAPFLHMPEWIEETYLEAGLEKLLTKTRLIYGQHGNVAEEEVYDADGKHAYTICKTYNERGDVLTETNRLGQQAAYTYDARGRVESSLNFSRRLQTSYQHDRKGRLRKKTEKGEDGVIHTTFAEYDFHDRQVQKRDLFGNTTHYAYDPALSAVTKTDFPVIASSRGEAIPVTTSATYDPLGRQLTQTDANGNTTIYRRNAYGSPTEIQHPHGGKESWKYAKNGECISYTDPDGLTTHYARDVLGRVLSKTYVAADGKEIAQETFTYNGFNLLTATDKEGNTTYYGYDGAGRKIREEFCGRLTDFRYDSLGWLSTVTKHNGDNTLFIDYTRDLEGRVTEERKTGAGGHLLYQIQYAYDADGNQSATTRYINGNEATDTFAFDSFKRQTLYRDAKGHETTTVYDEGFLNTLSQRVLQTRETDPLQITHIETEDALARLVKKEVVNSYNTTIACEEWFRDAFGNVVHHKDHIYEGEVFKDIQTIHYTYTPDHQIASCTRAFETTTPRTITYTYFPSGKMATKTFPDGITLSYSYHPLGFMSRLDSSDDTIHHAFDYNLLGHLRYAVDEQQQLTLTRKVDSFGNVCREVFSNGLEVEKDYDVFNRLSALKMGAQGKVLYAYDPLFLRKVTRVSLQGQVLYEHSYNGYDLGGHLLTENLIDKLGTVTHATDLNGCKLSISSLYFSQNCEYDAVNNLINLTTNGSERHCTYDQLSQLSSENSWSYAHDSLYNRVQKNGKDHEINELNELIEAENIQCSYDERGNQTLRQTPSETFHFAYDPLNRLIEATSQDKKIKFIYDPLDRRLGKTVFRKEADSWKEVSREHYLYNGQQEIGAFSSSHEPKNLRVLAQQKSNPATVAIELAGQVFAPILDVQGNIRRLVDPSAQTIFDSSDFTAFGEELHTVFRGRQFNPWRFASKRLDPELGLIYFGKRYYDPLFGRWLTTDPAGFVDSMNLYQYVLNNPFKYCDPMGDSLGGYLLGLGEIVLGGAIIAGGFALEVVTIGGFTFGVGVTTQTGAALIGLGLATTTYHAQDIKVPHISWKNTDVYVPDRPLPRDPRTKEPVPETDASHTELGTKKGTKGKYPQAREFDAQGRPVKDIDFTDHGRPQNHPNPHEHKWKPNSTGGTPQRSPEAEPITK